MESQKFARLHKSDRGKGFTLIELLIVIAIILILIAIALPNFLNAQIRARVTKAKGELRTLAVSLESYRIDWGIYPGRSTPSYKSPGARNSLVNLLEPIKYLESLPDDPFPLGYDFHTANKRPSTGPFTYFMTGVDNEPLENLLHPHGGGFLRAFVIFTAGPDSPVIEVDPEDGCMAFNRGSISSYYTYAPTNGTKSKGDVWIFGGEKRWMGLDVSGAGCAGSVKFYDRYRRVGVVYDNQRIFHQFPHASTL